MPEMTIKQYESCSFMFNNFLANGAFLDLTEDQWHKRPFDKLNHPLWIIAHLTGVRRDIVRNLGQCIERDEWEDKAAYKSECEDFQNYPEHNNLFNEFITLGEIIMELLPSASEDILDKPFIPAFPDNGDRKVNEAIGMLIAHEQLHIGQISAIRRLYDLPGISESLVAAMSKKHK